MGQILCILGFGDHTISLTITQLCLYSTKIVKDNMCTNMHGCVSVTLAWTLKIEFHIIFMSQNINHFVIFQSCEM